MKLITEIKMKPAYQLIVFVLAVFIGEVAHAEDVSEEQVLAAAISQSMEARSIDAVSAARLGEAVNLRNLANPQIEAELAAASRDTGEKSETEYEFSISQPLRLSQFGLRQATADLMKKAATQRQKLEILELTEKVRLAYAATWAFEAILKRVALASKRSNRFAKQVIEGQSRGLYAEADAKLFEAEELKINAELLALESAHSEVVARLVRLTSLAVIEGKNLKKPIERKLPSVQQALAALNSGTLPIQSLQKLRRQTASKTFEVAKRDVFPAFAPKVAFQHTDDGDERVMAGFSMELPFLDRNQGERIAKAAEAAAEKANDEYLSSESFASELRSILRKVELKNKEAQLLENKLIPALRSALESFENQLNAGQGVLFQLWQTQRELSEMEKQALLTWLEARKADSELRILLGGEI